MPVGVAPAPTATPAPPPEEEYVEPPPPAPEPAPEQPAQESSLGGTFQEAPAPVSGPPPATAEQGPPVPAQSTEPAPVEEAPAAPESSLGATFQEPAAAPAPKVIPSSGEARDTLKDTVVNADLGQRVMKEGLGAIPSAVGDVAGAFGQMVAAQGGDILPWGRAVKNEVATRAYEGDQPSDDILDDFGNLVFNPAHDAFGQAIQTEGSKERTAYEQGYTDPGTGNTYAPGPEAAWEAYVSDKPVWQRAVLDVAYDPTNVTLGTAAVKKAAPPIIGKAAGLVDDVVSLGIGPAIEGGLKVGKAALTKTGVLAPTARQAATTLAEEGFEAGQELAGIRRAAGQVQDVTSTELTPLTTGSPALTRLESPQVDIPGIVVAHDGKRVLGVVDDLSGKGDIRPITQADHANIVNLSTRLAPDDQLKLKYPGVLRSVDLPDATVSRPYLQGLQRALPKKPGTPLRGTIPTPASGADLLALRSELSKAALAKDKTVASALVLAAHRSGLLPTSVPVTVRETLNAINLVEAARGGPPVVPPAVLTSVQGTLRANLDRVGLSDVGIALGRTLGGVSAGRPPSQIEGQYFNGLITLATDLARTADEATLATRLGDVLNHETVHALRHYNLFKENEWRSLAEMARSTKMRGDATSFLDEVTTRYEAASASGAIPTSLSPEALVEEAVAEMYRAWVRGDLVPTPVQRSFFEKIAAFFRAMVASVPKPERVLANIESGVVGARKRAPVRTMGAPLPRVLSREEILRSQGVEIRPPRKTAAGPAYSVARFKAYHGSNRVDLTVLSPDPPARRFRTGTALLGGFVTGDESLGAAYASGGGRLYEVDVHMENPYHMDIRELKDRFEWEDDLARNAALDFKERLQREGYDGIIGWDGAARVDPDGTVPWDAQTKIREAILFDETPVKPLYSLAKGQSGVPPVRPGLPVVPGIYQRGSVEEYVGTRLDDETRNILDREYSFGGRTTKSWEYLVSEQDSLERARTIAQKARSGVPLTAGDRAALDQAKSRLGSTFTELKGVTDEQIADWSDEFVGHLAARRLERFIEQAGGLRNAAGELIEPRYYKGLAGRALKAYDNFTAFRRTMSLYSTTRGPAYVLMQAIGNGITLGIANPAALRYYSPIEAAKIARRDKTGYVTYVDRMRGDIGLGASKNLGGSRDQLAMGGQANQTFFERSTNPIVKGIGKIVANPNIKVFADANDINIRHAAYRSAFEPGYTRLRRDTISNAGQALSDAAARAGSPSPLSGDDFAQAIRGLGPRFSGEQLRKALTDPAVFGSAASSAVVRGAAERLTRDYINNVRTLDRLAMANVNRIGFDFLETNADAVLSRLFMFHYWLSRASVLYLTEAAKNPWQLQLWSRAMAQGNRKIEEGWPQWQKDMQEFMRTPAGITGLFNPAYLVGTYLFFQEGDTEQKPWEDLTRVGQTLQKTFLSNVMLNPLLQGAIYVLGAGGSDFRPPDIMGTGKWTGDLNTWLEKANRDVATFYATEKGNPKVVPNIDGRAMLSWVADQITQRGWQADFFGMAPISSFDANRTEQADLAYLIQDAVLKTPEGAKLNDGTAESAEKLGSLVEEALANPDSDLYQAAAENLVAVQTAGPGSGRDNAFLDIAGYYGRMVLPFGVTTQVTSRRERTIRANRDEPVPLDKELGYVDDATPEKQQFDIGLDASKGAWSPEASQIRNIKYGIRDGQLPEGVDIITIDGVSWDSAALAELPAADRNTLANYWMHTRHPDVGNQSGWEIEGAAYDAEEAVLADHPDVAEYKAFDDYVRDYDGGPIAAIEDTAAINANYRRFLETLPTDLTEAEYVEEATGVNAYAALKGVQYSRYDPTPMEAGKGAIAGLPEGQTLTDWKAKEQEAEAPNYDEKVDAEFANYQQAVEILNEHDPSGGLAATYTEEMKGYTFQGRQVDDTIYGILSGEGMTEEQIAPLNDKTNGYNKISFYLKWTADNGVTPGEQWEEYREQDSVNYLGKQVAAINAGERSDYDPTQDAPKATPESLVSDTDIYARPEKDAPWWQAAGNFLGKVADEIGGVFGDGPAPGTVPAQTVAPSQAAADPIQSFTIDATTYQGTPNRSDRPAPPQGIVYHYTAGSSIDEFIADFMGQTGRQASSNYIVDKDGSIYELIDPDQAAWTHGDVTQPNERALPLVEAGGGDPNMSAVGIEIVNEGDRDGSFVPYTPEQIAAVEYLTSYLVGRYGIPADEYHLIGHEDINTVGKRDPGPYFPWEQVLAAAAQAQLAPA